MKLRAWLDANDVSNAAFGEQINRTAEAVRRYAAGERIPDKETMPLIVNATGGEVTPNDFFDIEAPESPPPFQPQPQGTDLPDQRQPNPPAEKPVAESPDGSRSSSPSSPRRSTTRGTASTTSETPAEQAAA